MDKIRRMVCVSVNRSVSRLLVGRVEQVSDQYQIGWLVGWSICQGSKKQQAAGARVRTFRSTVWMQHKYDGRDLQASRRGSSRVESLLLQDFKKSRRYGILDWWLVL